MIGALSSQIYAKEGADDSSSGSSNDSSGRESEDRGRESENEQRGQEPEAERGGATEVRGQEFEAERGGALEVRGQEFEAERGGANEIRGEVEIGGITFEIRGTIASVSNNTLTVMGRTITIDPARVVNFQQTAPVAIGQSVKIEGSISNGTFLAREIKPLDGKDKNGSADDNAGSESSRKENRGLVASIGSIFGSIISSMINLFR